MNPSSIAFIGGGNMASALIGGLLKAGRTPASIQVVEPFEAQRQKLAQQFGIAAHAERRRRRWPGPRWWSGRSSRSSSPRRPRPAPAYVGAARCSSA